MPKHPEQYAALEAYMATKITTSLAWADISKQNEKNLEHLLSKTPVSSPQYSNIKRGHNKYINDARHAENTLITEREILRILLQHKADKTLRVVK
jgi:hypothetical protein